MLTSIVAPPLAEEIGRMGERIAELEAACRSGLAAVSRLRSAIDDEASRDHLATIMVETAREQAALEAALGEEGPSTW